MKLKNFTLLFSLFIFGFASAQDFTIQTGASTAEGFSFQMISESTVNVTIDWGNGIAESPSEGAVIPSAKSYSAPAGVSGSRTIKVYGAGVTGVLLTGGSTNPIVVDNFKALSGSTLKRVQLNECGLNSVDLSGASSLNSFSSVASNLTTLDLTGLLNVNTLNVSNSESLASILVSPGSSLTTLKLNNTALTNASLASILSNSPLLEDIEVNNDLVSTKISAVDFSANNQLTRISIMNNDVVGIIDLSGLANLTEVTFYNNAITGFICDSPVLTDLNLTGNQLANVDVTSCGALATISCSNNSDLISLDLSGNPLLTDVAIQNNALESVEFSPSVSLANLNVSNNAFNFESLPKVAVSGTYSFFGQTGRGSLIAISLGSDLISVDLTDVLSYVPSNPVPGTAGSSNKVARVMGYNKNTGAITEVANLPIPGMECYTVAGNVYTFNRTNLSGFSLTDVIYFEITNAAYPSLVLKTNEVELGKVPVGVEPGAEVESLLYYNSSLSEVCYSINGANAISVYNLGGSKVVSYSLVSEEGCVSVSELPAGVYVVVINTHEGSKITAKIVIR